ncbi:MAG TPA: DUF5661 family protein [Phototrophicaceae bacterium]|jgi:hypothetical protein|nr:DUF5661 family protein [Phototrophicaceae bacterium]
MSRKRKIFPEEARLVGIWMGIDWTEIDQEEFRCGLEFEFEHDLPDPITNIISNDLILAGKTAWAHLKEIRDYYTLLDQLETGEKINPWTTDWLLGRARKRS